MHSLHVLLLSVAALAVSSESFAGETVLLDFTASWCGPCRQMAPVVDQLIAAGHPVRKVDIDRERALAARYQVGPIPCFVMVVDGREVDRHVGATSRARLEQMLAKAAAAPVAGSRSDTGVVLPAQPSQPLATGAGTAQQSSGDDDEAQLVARLRAATVRLRINDPDGHSLGSGTLIDTAGDQALILTCGHIFRDSRGQGRIQVDLFGPGAPRGIEGQLLGYDLTRDIGLVVIRPGVPVVTARVAPAGYEPRRGDRVYSVGCSNGADPTVRRTHITSLDKYAGPPLIVANGQPVTGRSGGGLFSAQGRLIGVCNAADPQDNEGLYAALGSIYAELDRFHLAHLYRPGAEHSLASSQPPTSPDGPASVAPSSGPAGSRPPEFAGATAGVPRWEAAPLPSSAGTIAGSPTPLTAQEQAALRALQDGGEVIVVVRTADGGRQSIVLDNASPELFQQISLQRQLQSQHRLTNGKRLDAASSADEAPPRQPAAFFDPRSSRGIAPPSDWQPSWRPPGR
jgi:thiol-disulfide isomerase/thioredoxin